MRSFTFFATLAAAALSFAAPLVADAGAAADDAHLVRPGAAHVQARHENTVPAILVDVTTKVGVAIAPLTFITKDNCTVEHITPVVIEVKAILVVAIKEVTAITAGVVPAVGGVLDGALGAVFSIAGKVLSLKEIATIICGLLTVIFTAIGCVLKVVAIADKAVIVPLLIEIVQLVCALLKIVLCLVGGVIAILLPLIGEVFAVVKALGCIDLFTAIGLKL